MKKKIQKLYETTSPNNSKFLCACLSTPECDLYAASDETKAIYIWKRGIETPLISLTGISSLVTSLILNGTEAELYSGLKGGLVVIWDLESSKVKYNLQGHSTEISQLAMAKCESLPTYLASASVDGKIKWWDLRTKGAMLNLKGHTAAVKSLAISPDCNYIASGAEDGLARLWDLRTNKLIKEFSIEDQGTVNTIEFNPCNYTLAYGSNDKLIKHWDLNTFSLISVTPVDRLPIMKLKFDHTGENLFSATNETLKYWNVDDDITKLLYMTETGWNKLRDMQYVEDEAVFAISTYANKIEYFMIPYDIIVNNIWNKKGNDHVKRAKSDLISEFNYVDDNIKKHMNNLQNNNQSNLPNNYMNNNQNVNKINSSNKILSDFYTTENILNQNQNDNVFLKNGRNIITAMNVEKDDYFNQNNINNSVNNKNEIIIQKNVVINNISSIINLSQNNQNETFNFDFDNLDNFDIDNINNITNCSRIFSENINNITTTTSNFDMNKFIEGGNLDDTIHEVSQKNDIPVLQEINEQHNTIKSSISKRYNSLKMVLKWWSESNLTSAINAVNLMKDKSIVNDFFNNALCSREDVNKIPFSLDNAICLLPLVHDLINSKYDVYKQTGFKTGSILLRIFSEKVSMLKSNQYGNDQYKEERKKKCENVIENFDKIFTKLSELRKKKRDKSLDSLCTDLEFFLKPYKK